MCFACGSQWPPWSRPVHIAPPPVKEETIYVDDTTQFYPDHRQGIHPPGPVYQNFGPTNSVPVNSGLYAAAAYPAQGMYGMTSVYGVPNMYNYQATGYGPQQFAYPQTAANYASGQMAFATSPADLTAQAAAAAEHNKQVAAMPNAPPYIVANQADIAAQAAALGQNMHQAPVMTPAHTPVMMSGAAQAVTGGGGSTTLAPYKPSEGHQFWCRETDGAWTLRGYSEICLGDVSPGHWEKHAVSGYFFWVRHLS